MTKHSGLRAGVWLCATAYLAAVGVLAAQAADLAPEPGPAPGPVYGYFNPVADPRCRIIPAPERNLYGDTARFRPTAVCQSRGLYLDSVLFP